MATRNLYLRYRVFGQKVGFSNVFQRASSSTTRVDSTSVTEKLQHFRQPKEGITVTDDGCTIVCYHPEPEFPYEHTMPLERSESELQFGSSVLKVQHIQDYQERFFRDHQGPTRKELMQMFHNYKIHWFPHSRRRELVRFRYKAKDDGTLAEPNPMKDSPSYL